MLATNHIFRGAAPVYLRNAYLNAHRSGGAL